MYTQQRPQTTTIVRNESYEGETMEHKVQRLTNNKEPINDSSRLIYTDRKDGVMPEYDIRTDRWEVALDAMDKHVTGTHRATREQRIGERTYDTMNEQQQKEFNEKFPKNKHNKSKETGGQSTQATGTNENK